MYIVHVPDHVKNKITYIPQHKVGCQHNNYVYIRIYMHHIFIYRLMIIIIIKLLHSSPQYINTKNTSGYKVNVRVDVVQRNPKGLFKYTYT